MKMEKTIYKGKSEGFYKRRNINNFLFSKGKKILEDIHYSGRSKAVYYLKPQNVMAVTEVICWNRGTTITLFGNKNNIGKVEMIIKEEEEKYGWLL